MGAFYKIGLYASLAVWLIDSKQFIAGQKAIMTKLKWQSLLCC